MTKLASSIFTVAVLAIALTTLPACSLTPGSDGPHSASSSSVSPNFRRFCGGGVSKAIANTPTIVGSVTVHAVIYSVETGNSCALTNTTYASAYFVSPTGVNETISATYYDGAVQENTLSKPYSNATSGYVDNPTFVCNAGDTIQVWATITGDQSTSTPIVVSATCP